MGRVKTADGTAIASRASCAARWNTPKVGAYLDGVLFNEVSSSSAKGSPTIECVYAVAPATAGLGAFPGGLPRLLGGTNGGGATR